MIPSFRRACLLALTCTLDLAAQPLPRAAAALAPIIEDFVAAHDRAGVSIALVDGGGLAWTGAYGLADREKKTAATDQTIFELGSISKVFTCIAVMQLAEAGRLDLDKAFVSYVPEFAVKSRFATGGEAITVRMLMTHHSGLVTDDDPWETTHPARLFHRAVLEHVKETELRFPPGERWNYSSFGTSLLGVLIERVSGMDYADYMRKRVLVPLGMANASFDIRDLPAERIAAAYHYNTAYDLIPKDEIRPGGSLRSPLAEAARLLSLVLGGGTFQGQALLKPESMAEMTRLQNGGNPLAKDTPMGLGFRIRARGDLSLLYHDGASRHRSVFLLAPGRKAGMIVAVNDHQGADTFLWELREAFMAALPAL